ncbi:MAG TPA: hypothetical protein VIG96_12510, partial [Blastococcus sp.]
MELPTTLDRRWHARRAQSSFLPGLAQWGAVRAQIDAVRLAAGGRGLGTAMIGWAIGEARRRSC